VNAKDNYGGTPLDRAISSKKKSTASFLRKHSGKTKKEWEAEGKAAISIHNAAHAGNIEAIKQHLAAGTDVNMKNKFGSTPLLYAANYGQKEITELLIANSADVNAINNGGFTPLHSAANSNHKEVVELLITAGADVNAVNLRGQTALDLAESKEQKEIADLLRKHGGKTAEELKAEGK